MFLAISQELGLNIWASTEKKRIFNALEEKNILDRLSNFPDAAGLHVMEMGKVKDCKFLNEYLKKYSGNYSHILSIIPTGWTHQKGSSSENSLKGMNIKNFKHSFSNVSQLEVPYSEHSSFSELRRFVMFLKLANANCVIPTVNIGNANSRENMNKLFKSWIAESFRTENSVLRLNKEKTFDKSSMNKTHSRFAQFIGN